MHNRAANVYRRVDLDSAPKAQILTRLFDRFAADIVAARTAIDAHDIAGKANAIDHALRIVGELIASLDHAAAPELCANLAALYEYVSDRLTTANLTLSKQALDEGSYVMGTIGDAFRGAP